MQFKRIFFLLAGFVLLLSVSAPSVLAGSEKTNFYSLVNPDDYTCEGGGSASGSTGGFANINTNGKPGKVKKVIVEVSLKGVLPNTSYQIYVSQDPGDPALCFVTSPQGVVVTNAVGNGNFHVTIAKGPVATHFWVSATGGGQTLRSPAVTLD